MSELAGRGAGGGGKGAATAAAVALLVAAGEGLFSELRGVSRNIASASTANASPWMAMTPTSQGTLDVAGGGTAAGDGRTGQRPMGRLDRGRIDRGRIDRGGIGCGGIDSGGGSGSAMDVEGSTTGSTGATGGGFPSRAGAADPP
jgi:hypothetical protein